MKAGLNCLGVSRFLWFFIIGLTFILIYIFKIFALESTFGNWDYEYEYERTSGAFYFGKVLEIAAGVSYIIMFIIGVLGLLFGVLGILSCFKKPRGTAYNTLFYIIMVFFIIGMFGSLWLEAGLGYYFNTWGCAACTLIAAVDQSAITGVPLIITLIIEICGACRVCTNQGNVQQKVIAENSMKKTMVGYVHGMFLLSVLALQAISGIQMFWSIFWPLNNSKGFTFILTNDSWYYIIVAILSGLMLIFGFLGFVIFVMGIVCCVNPNMTKDKRQKWISGYKISINVFNGVLLLFQVVKLIIAVIAVIVHQNYHHIFAQTAWFVVILSFFIFFAITTAVSTKAYYEAITNPVQEIVLDGTQIVITQGVQGQQVVLTQPITAIEGQKQQLLTGQQPVEHVIQKQNDVPEQQVVVVNEPDQVQHVQVQPQAEIVFDSSAPIQPIEDK